MLKLSFIIWESGGSVSEGLDLVEQGLFIINSPMAKLKNLFFEENETANLFLGINYLTEEVGEKVVYAYHVEQFENESFYGGEQFVFQRDERHLFLADAGDDESVEEGLSIELKAGIISESARYNWYNEEGDLIYSGTDTTFIPTENTVYTLEVVALSDGFKDYDQKEVKVKKFFIENIYPNPALYQNSFTVDYTISGANNAYMSIINSVNGQVFNFILNLNSSSVNLNPNLPRGNYQITLIANGVIQDVKPLTIN